MERESFENPVIAKKLNAHFVSIKVDREERPDVDKIYMSFVQAITVSGGWPMSVWLTPDLKPFFGGTYFPPEDLLGRPGFSTILEHIATLWTNEQEKLLSQSDTFIKHLRHFTTIASSSTLPDPDLLNTAYTALSHTYDASSGGFGDGPKFPLPANLFFLTRYYAHQDSATPEAQQTLEQILFTLRKMAQGGIHDILGGGFHRYSVDRYWHVPHFEKMLYDQAQLALAYLDAFQITQEAFYADIVHRILGYVQRDLQHEAGGFYAAEDADSLPTPDAIKKAEGAFYVWTEQEITALLGATNAALFNYHYDVRPKGNVANNPHEEFTGKNILIQRHSLAKTAQAFQRTEAAASTLLQENLKNLFNHRAQRPRPHRDDKILTAWNGLMLSAFARAAAVLDAPDYRRTATRAATFLYENLYRPQTGTLLRSYRKRPSTIAGFLSDYALLIQGLLDLYETTFDLRWLQWALELQNQQDHRFLDREGGGYYDTTANAIDLLLRLKDSDDGALPSPNSIAALNLLRLAHITDNQTFRQQAKATLQTFSQKLNQLPRALPYMLVALDLYHRKPLQIVLAGKRDDSRTHTLVREIHRRFLPHKILLLIDDPKPWETLAPAMPFLPFVKPLNGKPTAYVCQDYTCQLPTNDPHTLSQLLKPSVPQ